MAEIWNLGRAKFLLPPPHRRGNILFEYQSVCPFVRIGPPPPSSECVPPWNQRGGQHLLAVRGRGSQFGRLERKPGTLCSLWRHCHFLSGEIIQRRLLLPSFLFILYLEKCHAHAPLSYIYTRTGSCAIFVLLGQLKICRQRV
jgi:hypothetical protein